MSENLEAKKQLVGELKEQLKDAKSMLFVDYRGITVAEDTALRKNFRNENVTYTYDESTKTVTAIMTVGGGATASVNMIYTGKAFKVTSDSIKGTSNLYTGNTGTLSLYK